MVKVTIGSKIITAAAKPTDRRTHFQLICWIQSGHGLAARAPLGPPGPAGPGGPAAPLSRSCRGRGSGVFSAALTCSSGSRCRGVVGGLSRAALTSSIGSACREDRSSVTGGMIVVIRSSGGTWRRGPADERASSGPPGFPRAWSTPSVAGPPEASLDDWWWRPSLFTGRAGAVARRPRSSCPSRGPWRSRRPRWTCRAQDIRLDQVIPTAGPAHLHDVHRKLREPGGEHDQLLGGPRRARDRAQVLAEHPGHDCQLLLTADRADHSARFPVKLCGAQQIGICVTDLGDAGAPRVHLGQQ